MSETMSNERIETQGLNEETAFREPGVVPTPVDVNALQQGVISRNAPRPGCCRCCWC